MIIKDFLKDIPNLTVQKIPIGTDPNHLKEIRGLKQDYLSFDKNNKPIWKAVETAPYNLAEPIEIIGEEIFQTLKTALIENTKYKSIVLYHWHEAIIIQNEPCIIFTAIGFLD